MAVTASTPLSLVEQVYDRLPERVGLGRERLGRPLTLAEKILINHLRDAHSQQLERGSTATPTSIPIVLPCRTQPRRWRCCNS